MASALSYLVAMPPFLATVLTISGAGRSRGLGHASHPRRAPENGAQLLSHRLHLSFSHVDPEIATSACIFPLASTWRGSAASRHACNRHF
eukprot:3940802-Rhodomonas_salina.1